MQDTTTLSTHPVRYKNFTGALHDLNHYSTRHTRSDKVLKKTREAEKTRWHLQQVFIDFTSNVRVVRLHWRTLKQRVAGVGTPTPHTQIRARILSTSRVRGEGGSLRSTLALSGKAPDIRERVSRSRKSVQLMSDFV